MQTKVFSYILLTKPRIMVLVVLSGVTALCLEGSLLQNPIDFVLVISGLFLTGGSANALNQVFEHKIDLSMTRTKQKRPIPNGSLNIIEAFIFAVSIGIIGIIILVHFNLFAAILALFTILFYSLIYTLVLKKYTALSTVIGGLAGAMVPVGAWVAAKGYIEPMAVVLFFIIFLWSPPHFWAVAIIYKNDYKQSRLPMLPITAGTRGTINHIIVYSFLVLAISILPFFLNSGWFYLVIAIISGVILLYKAIKLKTNYESKYISEFFTFSLIYLLAIFSALILDRILV